MKISFLFFQNLYKQYDGTEKVPTVSKPLGNVDIKIYEQYFESSCGDIDRKRYREVDDIDEM